MGGWTLGARQVWGKLGNLLGLLSPAPSDVSEFCARGEPEASRRLLTCCHRAGEAGLKSTVSISLGPRNYESDRSSFVAVQLLDFLGFFCRLY